VALEDRAQLLQAAGWSLAGIEFQDALHLAKSANCLELATFDRRFARRSNRLGLAPTLGVPGA
jgi:predicted nucleic acid-binding protein